MSKTIAKSVFENASDNVGKIQSIQVIRMCKYLMIAQENITQDYNTKFKQTLYICITQKK